MEFLVKLHEKLKGEKARRAVKFMSWGFLCGFLVFLIGLVCFVVCLKNALFSSRELFLSVLNNQPEKFEDNFQKFSRSFYSLEKKIKLIDRISLGTLDKKSGLNRKLAFFEKVVPLLPGVLGRDGERIYFILLQNNMELRPSGGFMGSYAKLRFKNGGLSEILIQDIYVPDGQLPGHVEPPWPIQEAFGQGWWKLRDANWDADFSKAAPVISWFFEKGGEERPDGIVAVNFSLFENLLPVFGQLQLLNYPETVSVDNLYHLAQAYSEVSFFPGSTQKKDILSDLGRAFLSEAKKLETSKLVKILPIVGRNLEQRQILFYFSDQVIQQIFQEDSLDGSMRDISVSSAGELKDYLYIVESNLGANKANCCVERKVEQRIWQERAGFLKEELIVSFTNTSKLSTPQPSVYWGGDYVNFLRLYLPSSAERVKIDFEGEEIDGKRVLFEERKDLGIVGRGFFIKIPASSQKTVKVNYELPVAGQNYYSLYNHSLYNYSLYIQKQPGVSHLPYSMSFFQEEIGGYRLVKELKRDIYKDEEIFVELRLYN